MTATSINHVSVHAHDLDESVAFYEDLFGMRRIPTPNFAFPVQWLRGISSRSPAWGVAGPLAPAVAPRSRSRSPSRPPPGTSCCPGWRPADLRFVPVHALRRAARTAHLTC